MNKKETALKVLKNGFNCAQAVCTAFCEDFGVKKEDAAKMACGLGAGLSRSGEVCGAVSGAIMVLGLKHGNSLPEDVKSKEKAYLSGREFKKHFEYKHRTIICRNLIGMDISTEEGLQAAREKGVFENICKDLVASSVEILEDMLKR